MFQGLEKKYFNKQLSRRFIYLYTGQTLRDIAGVLWGVFYAIFVYNLFKQNLSAVLIYFSIIHLIYGIIVMFGAKFLSKYDFKKGLQASSFFIVFYYLIFYFATPDNWPYLVTLAVIIRIFFMMSYWVPYHTDFAKFTNKKIRTRQVSILRVLPMIFGIFGPVIAGYIIAQAGFKFLFIVVIIFLASSAIPYTKISKTHEKFTWGILETWKRFFSKKNRKLVMAYLASGAEGFIGGMIWPIFIYELLEGDYLKVGILSTLIIGFTVILQIILGKYIDVTNTKRKFLKWSSSLYAAGWLFKIFINTAFQIFVVGVYHSITGLFLATSFDSLNYELAADNGHYVDEYTVLREMAINISAGLTGFVAVIVSMHYSVQAIFVLAALAAVLCSSLGAQELRKPLVP